MAVSAERGKIVDDVNVSGSQSLRRVSQLSNVTIHRQFRFSPPGTYHSIFTRKCTRLSLESAQRKKSQGNKTIVFSLQSAVSSVKMSDIMDLRRAWRKWGCMYVCVSANHPYSQPHIHTYNLTCVRLVSLRSTYINKEQLCWYFLNLWSSCCKQSDLLFILE